MTDHSNDEERSLIVHCVGVRHRIERRRSGDDMCASVLDSNHSSASFSVGVSTTTHMHTGTGYLDARASESDLNIQDLRADNANLKARALLHIKRDWVVPRLLACTVTANVLAWRDHDLQEEVIRGIEKHEVDNTRCRQVAACEFVSERLLGEGGSCDRLARQVMPFISPTHTSECRVRNNNSTSNDLE